MATSRESTELQLRPARDADRSVILALLEAHRLPTDGVAAALPGFVVAERHGRLVGMIGLETYGAFGLLRSAAVDDAAQRHGVGRALVGRLLEDAAARRLTAIYLLTTTAEGYFQKFGFRPTTRDAVPESVRRSVEFTVACPASATVMVLRLSPAARP
jgi:amino-acid N-acetyltransferase